MDQQIYSNCLIVFVVCGDRYFHFPDSAFGIQGLGFPSFSNAVTLSESLGPFLDQYAKLTSDGDASFILRINPILRRSLDADASTVNRQKKSCSVREPFWSSVRDTSNIMY